MLMLNDTDMLMKQKSRLFLPGAGDFCLCVKRCRRRLAQRETNTNNRDKGESERETKVEEEACEAAITSEEKRRKRRRQRRDRDRRTGARLLRGRIWAQQSKHKPQR